MNEPPLNVLVLMCDHLRYDAMSWSGGPVATPALDRLAARSVRCHRAITNSPLCGPARHSLATGKLPYRHGVVDNIHLPHPGMHTIAHHVRAAGWRTDCFGHMHWQRLPDTPGEDDFTDHGYETYHCIHHAVPPAKAAQVMWERISNTIECAAGPSILDAAEGYAHQVAEASIARIRACHAAGERFLSWTSFDEPHPPFYAPPEYYADIDQAALPLAPARPPDASPLHPGIARRMHRSWPRFNAWDHRRMQAGYYGLVRYTDACIGRILDELDRLDLWRNTMVILTADHGDQLGEHGLYFKSNFREGSVHIPFTVYHPDLAPGDRQALVEHVDILPTVCDFLGITPPPNCDGQSLRPMLADGDAASTRQYAISHLATDIMVRDDRWKLVCYDGVPGELFDLQADPHEFYNRLADPAAAAARDRLSTWLAATHPDLLPATRAAQTSGRIRRKKRKPAVMLLDVD